MNKQQLQQKITDMECELAEMKALLSQSKSTYWQPKKKEQYFYVNHNLKINYGYFDPSHIKDQIRYRVFQTEAEAQKYANYIKAEETIRKAIAEANEGWLPNWDDHTENKYFISLASNQLVTNDVSIFKAQPNFMYIKSSNSTQFLIRDYKQEFTTYLFY